MNADDLVRSGTLIGGCLTDEDVPTFSEYALHNWRLVSREWFDVSVSTEDARNIGWQETWYCTRCRLVDDRITSGNTDERERLRRENHDLKVALSNCVAAYELIRKEQA